MEREKQLQYMSSNELIKLITDNNLQEIFCEFGMNYYTFIHFFEYERKVDFETFERLKLHRAESVDSAYNSDELYNVVYFKDYNIYLKFTGEYDSYGSGNHNYNGSIREVFPKEVTVIQYN